VYRAQSWVMSFAMAILGQQRSDAGGVDVGDEDSTHLVVDDSENPSRCMLRPDVDCRGCHGGCWSRGVVVTSSAVPCRHRSRDIPFNLGKDHHANTH
jgi:hypothetical protein